MTVYTFMKEYWAIFVALCVNVLNNMDHCMVYL